eukprot:jgi/Botrbrau1/16073/Bobra.7_2s0044.1
MFCPLTPMNGATAVAWWCCLKLEGKALRGLHMRFPLRRYSRKQRFSRRAIKPLVRLSVTPSAVGRAVYIQCRGYVATALREEAHAARKCLVMRLQGS